MWHVSFASSARKVLDTSLPLNVRINGLKGCVQRYRPIGFAQTLSFLETVAGNYGSDPDALPRALDLLRASHTAWQAELHAYSLLRRRAKQLGYRVPHSASHNPNKPLRWHGAPREAALHAVWFWYSKGDCADVDMHCLGAALAQCGRFTAAQQVIFDEVHAGLRERHAAEIDTRDYSTSHELRTLLAVARQMAVVTGNA